MNTDKIRAVAESIIGTGGLAFSIRDAFEATADALDELDERTWGGVSTSTLSADADLSKAVAFPSDEEIKRAAHPSTIPGCYCRDCKWCKSSELEDFWWCECAHPDAHASGVTTLKFGCVFGERREEVDDE